MGRKSRVQQDCGVKTWSSEPALWALLARGTVVWIRERVRETGGEVGRCLGDQGVRGLSALRSRRPTDA